MECEDRKIYPDKEKFIESELDRIKNSLSKMLDKLPNKELPFMEPHLRALYFETYFLLAQEFYNSSLVLMGILLENFTKEKLLMEGTSNEELEKMTFGEVIKKCRQNGFLDVEELSFLENKKKTLRDPYAHYNKMKLSKGIYFPTGKIHNPVEKLKQLHKRVEKGELTESQARQELIKGIKLELMSSKEFPPMAQIAKSEKEKSSALDIFLEIDKFIREFAEKYFKPKE